MFIRKKIRQLELAGDTADHELFESVKPKLLEKAFKWNNDSAERSIVQIEQHRRMVDRMLTKATTVTADTRSS